MRYGYDVDIIGLDASSLSSHEVSQVEYGHCLISAQVGTAIIAEETVDLSL